MTVKELILALQALPPEQQDYKCIGYCGGDPADLEELTELELIKQSLWDRFAGKSGKFVKQPCIWIKT